MSLIGKSPITIPAGVSVKSEGKQVTVTGPKGTLTLNLPQQIEITLEADKVLVKRTSEAKVTKSNHGTIRAHIANMVNGVVTPYSKSMEIRGTGYKFVLQGNKLVVSAGYIHPVEVLVPTGLTFTVPDETKLTITGPDINLVGQTASNIRKIRKPEVYKGKGIRYANEFIKLKPGKAAKAGA